MSLRAAVLLIPGLIWAQASPPALPAADVEQALRARAGEFLQYQLDGNPRKAYDLVAEDTKDYYFTAPRNKILAFKIDSIEYSKESTEAAVSYTVRQKWNIAGREIEVPQALTDTWKLEGGKWMWFHKPDDAVRMSMGTGPAKLPGVDTAAAPSAAGAPVLPKDTSPETVRTAAMAALRGNAAADGKPPLDKAAVEFTAGADSVVHLVFHNSRPGQVKLTTQMMVENPSITLSPKEVFVAYNSDASVTIEYQPHEQTAPAATAIRLRIEPFGNTLLVPVKFIPAK